MSDITQIYFAYGSNLNSDHLKNYGFGTEELVPIGPANLLDRDLRFSRMSRNWGGGVLDAVVRVGSVVPGIMFQVKNESVWRKIDQKEGAPNCYKRIPVKASLPTGEIKNVITYEVCEKEEFVEPATDYVELVRDGYEQHDLPNSCLEAAVNGEKITSALDSIFLYGTLMRFESRHPVINKSKPKCVLLAETYGQLVDCGSFPGFILSTVNDQVMVKGEFCLFPKGELPLSELDRIEGFNGWEAIDNLYYRTVIDVGMCDGRIRFAWIYVWNGNVIKHKVIPSGDWRANKDVKSYAIEQIIQGHTCNRSMEEIIQHLCMSWNDVNSNLFDALYSGMISERKIAQVSNQWYSH